MTRPSTNERGPQGLTQDISTTRHRSAVEHRCTRPVGRVLSQQLCELHQRPASAADLVGLLTLGLPSEILIATMCAVVPLFAGYAVLVATYSRATSTFLSTFLEFW